MSALVNACSTWLFFSTSTVLRVCESQCEGLIKSFLYQSPQATHLSVRASKDRHFICSRVCGSGTLQGSKGRLPASSPGWASGLCEKAAAPSGSQGASFLAIRRVWSHFSQPPSPAGQPGLFDMADGVPQVKVKTGSLALEALELKIHHIYGSKQVKAQPRFKQRGQRLLLLRTRSCSRRRDGRNGWRPPLQTTYRDHFTHVNSTHSVFATNQQISVLTGTRPSTSTR